MSKTCPSCRQPADGRFCSHCGAAVEAECRECGSSLPPGARFCNQCGAAAAPGADAPGPGPASVRASPLPWALAGVAVLALAAVLAWALLRGGDPAEAPAAPGPPLAGSTAPSPAAPAPGGNAGGVDLSSMTPREAADRLFNRVMQNVSSGDTAQARAFLPMAIQAYARVGELDTDGRYHLAVLHLVNGDPQSARTESGLILATDPQHLFGLFTGAQAEAALGNRARARELYQRFLAAFETERTRDLPEYRDHQQALTPMREEAQRVLGGS